MLLSQKFGLSLFLGLCTMGAIGVCNLSLKWKILDVMIFSTLEININFQQIIIYLSGEWDLLKRIQNLVSLYTVNSSASDDGCQQHLSWVITGAFEGDAPPFPLLACSFPLIISLQLEWQPHAKNHSSTCDPKPSKCSLKKEPQTGIIFLTMNHLLTEEKHLFLFYKI